MSRPHTTDGGDSQGRATHTSGVEQWPCDIAGAMRTQHAWTEGWHDTYPSAPAPLKAETLPELLLRKGAMSGPHRRTRPVFFGPVRRFVRALLGAIFSTRNERKGTTQ